MLLFAFTIAKKLFFLIVMNVHEYLGSKTGLSDTNGSIRVLCYLAHSFLITKCYILDVRFSFFTICFTFCSGKRLH